MVRIILSDDTVLKKNLNVIERGGEEELLLFDPSTGKLFELNETGKIVWRLLDGKHTVKEIKSILKNEFPESSNIDEDISAFLKKLLGAKLAEKCEEQECI